MSALEKGNLMHLMQQKGELLVGALGDMLRTLIIAFPYGANIPHIFKMAFLLIEANLKEKHDLAMLKLYHFIIMEFNDNLNLKPELEKLFTDNSGPLIEDLDL